jgi:hypothetical protein
VGNFQIRFLKFWNLSEFFKKVVEISYVGQHQLGRDLEVHKEIVAGATENWNNFIITLIHLIDLVCNLTGLTKPDATAGLLGRFLLIYC